MSERSTGFRAPFSVFAAFSQEDDAGVAVDALVTRGVPLSAITMYRPDNDETGAQRCELEAEMQDELVRNCDFLSGSQVRRAFGAAITLGLLGIVLGVLAGLAWAYLFSSGFSRLTRVVTLAAGIGLAGVAIGFGDGGLGLKRRWGEEPDPDTRLAAERDVLVALHVCDLELAERTVALLRGLGAEWVDLFDAHGTLLPP